jgi:hypothetical protein
MVSRITLYIKLQNSNRISIRWQFPQTQCVASM